MPKTGYIENNADSYLTDKKIIGKYNLEYKSEQDWGFINTPASSNAKSIAEKISYEIPYIFGQALYEILVNVFDNVANYGMKNGKAKCTVLATLDDDDFDIYVSNMTDRTLPPTLKDRTYSASDGIITVPEDERDANTGGGWGVRYITKYLPHTYTKLVETNKSASVSWMQKGEEVIFRLNIPTPSESELTRYKDYRTRREQKKKAFDAAKQYIIETNNADGSKRKYEISYPAETAIPVLRQALRSGINFPEDSLNSFFKTIDILKTIQAYGKQASSASEEIIDIIMTNIASFHGIEVLMDIEKEKGEFFDYFAESIDKYQSEDNRHIEAIAEYFKSNYNNRPHEDSQQLKEKLVENFVDGKAQKVISESFISLDPFMMPESSLEKVVDKIISEGKYTDKNAISMRFAFEIIEAQESVSQSIKDKIEQTMGFEGSDKLSYDIRRLIKELPTTPGHTGI